MVTKYFYKFLYINITKTWGATNEPKFKGSKKLEGPKNTWAQLREEPNLIGST
jgi:hypothetical protein